MKQKYTRNNKTEMLYYKNEISLIFWLRMRSRVNIMS